jgi:outer membrane protein OmpA-like peptidoglycan-associated protein
MKTLLPKISVKAGGSGDKKPAVSNATKKGRAQNRRAEIATW